MSKNTNLSFLTDYITADITNGRIGINNASPTVAFDVTGAGKFSGVATAKSFSVVGTNGYSGQIIQQGDIFGSAATNLLIQSSTSNGIGFLTNGGTTFNMFINSAGNVGIGTTSPTRLLDVSAAGAAYIRASDTTNSVNVDMLAASSGGWIGTQSNHSFQIQTNNSERMRINSVGNIGIGTTSISTGYTGGTGSITIQNARALAFNNASDTFNTSNAGGGITYFTDNNLYIDAKDTASNMIFRVNAATERMRILANGNVGIGTSAPGYKLEVNGTGYFSSTLSTAGTLSSANLSTSQVLYATNLTTFNYAYDVTVTVPNALNSGSTAAEIRMYMIWATGFGDAVHGGGRIWLMIMNGGGTDYSSTELLGRDTAGGSGLAISRSAVNQVTVSSNGYGYIKSISCMQLITQ